MVTENKTPSHYNFAVQPIDYIMENDLGFCEGSIVKYITRYEQKGGVSDLKKIIHFCEFLIARESKRNDR
ncbi:MAG: DUF3310 domain-containing protein [Flavobacteriales bacterium]|nr:DUF3310 domain-containing protein [Flavobacteriales bacterium]